MTLPNADLVVADPCAKRIVRITHEAGGQKAVRAGGKFAFPKDLRVAADGSIIVADRDALGGAAAIIRVDPKSGTQTILSDAGLLAAPVGIAVVPH